MALLSSRELQGQACPVCGSPDRACGGHGPSAEVVPVDAGLSGKGKPRGPATIMARARVNGVETIFKTTPEEAERRGWTPIGAEALVEPEPETPAEVKAKAKAPNKARSSSSARNTSRKASDK